MVDLGAEATRFATLFSLTVRHLVTSRRGLATAALAAVPLVVAVGLALGGAEGFDVVLLQVFAIPLEFQVVLIFVTLVHATALVREEIEDETLPYLLLRPVAKPAVAAYKYVGYLAAVLLLLLPPLALAYVVTQAYAGQPLAGDLDVAAALLAAAALAAAAYGAIFLFLSLLVRKPLGVGLLFGFVWEAIVGGLPGDVPRLSVIHYVRSLIKGLVEVGPLSTYATDVPPGAAAAVLAGIALAGVVLAMVVIQGMEFKQKA
jgi:ABC-2 type transport system permease protein